VREFQAHEKKFSIAARRIPRSFSFVARCAPHEFDDEADSRATLSCKFRRAMSVATRGADDRLASRIFAGFAPVRDKPSAAHRDIL
jgi:hypothetical protein